jgi:uncharacterized peroxidase-related enzyme
VRAHQEDLRVEVAKQLEEDAAIPADDRAARADAFSADVASQGSEAAPEPRLRALLQYAERLALAPGDMNEEHVAQLRALGLDDRTIHDATQVVAYFSYINRVADGLGVDPEPGA